MGATEPDSRSGASHEKGAAGTLAALAPGTAVVVGSSTAGGIRLGVVCARYNAAVTARLLLGARRAWQEAGIADGGVVVVEVPGAFELPLAAQGLAESGRVDAVICLGTVIRGETSHNELVAGEAARGCMQVQLDTAVPVVFGVVTTENLHQALERSGGGHGNKGAESVATALEMVALVHELEKHD